jgi:hypothetical protein
MPGRSFSLLSWAAIPLVLVFFPSSASAFFGQGKLLLDVGKKANSICKANVIVRQRQFRPAFTEWRAATSVRIASYNVLSSSLSEPDYYTSTDPEHLDPSNRLAKVISQLVCSIPYTNRWRLYDSPCSNFPVSHASSCPMLENMDGHPTQEEFQ